MNTTFFRIGTFCVFVLVAMTMVAQDEVFNRDFGIGGGSGGGPGCYICAGSYSGGHATGWCATPDPGGYGAQYCQVDTYENSTTCSTGGYGCCVD